MFEARQRAVRVPGGEGFGVDGFCAVFGVESEGLLDECSLVDEVLGVVFEVGAFEGVVDELGGRVVHVQVLLDRHVGEAGFLALLDVVEVAADEGLGEAFDAQVFLQRGEAVAAVQHSLELLDVHALALLVEHAPRTGLFAFDRSGERGDLRLFVFDVFF